MPVVFLYLPVIVGITCPIHLFDDIFDEVFDGTQACAP